MATFFGNVLNGMVPHGDEEAISDTLHAQLEVSAVIKCVSGVIMAQGTRLPW
jgi:hypothetical protein